MNLELSKLVSDRTNAQPRRCFENALAGQKWLARLGIVTLYCEGWAYANGLSVPLEHAWLSVFSAAPTPYPARPGDLIDPTWVEEGNRYHSIICLPLADVETLRKSSPLIPLWLAQARKDPAVNQRVYDKLQELLNTPTS